MIERNTLTYNHWIDTFWKYWRNIDYDLGSSIGWVTSLRPIRIGTPKNASMITMLELLALLQLSDSNDVLIFHTISIKEPSRQYKLFLLPISALIRLLLCQTNGVSQGLPCSSNGRDLADGVKNKKAPPARPRKP
jgi:hypothetical protein